MSWPYNNILTNWWTRLIWLLFAQCFTIRWFLLPFISCFRGCDIFANTYTLCEMECHLSTKTRITSHPADVLHHQCIHIAHSMLSNQPYELKVNLTSVELMTSSLFLQILTITPVFHNDNHYLPNHELYTHLHNIDPSQNLFSQ